MSVSPRLRQRTPTAAGDGASESWGSRPPESSELNYSGGASCGAVGALPASERIASVPHAAFDVQPNSSWTLEPSRPEVVGAVVRRLVPHLIEATVIPTALFYVVLASSGLRWAFAAAIAWSYVAIVRRVMARRRVPALLILSGLGITVRTVTLLASTNTFVYFVQPIFGTVATAAALLASVALGRPLIARFAHDFCPLSTEVASRPGVEQLFKRLTYLWAGLTLFSAAVNVVLLLALPVNLYVGVKTVSGWAVRVLGIVLTVSVSLRTARREGLATAVSPTGSLHAYAVAA
ncbi:MAG: putative rane protein [Acidimicrobiia bacterium]|nr:putative rane protein [Acidimicrobiia bacterium]